MYSPPTTRADLAKDNQLDAGCFDGSLFGLSGNNNSVIFNPALAYALAFGSTETSPSMAPTSTASAGMDPFAFDQLLQSPLGLEESPQSSMMASPLFDTSPTLPTGSAPASGAFTPLPFDDNLAFPSLFAAFESAASTTHLRPNPEPITRRSSDPFDLPFSLDAVPAPIPAPTTSAPTPAPAPAPAPAPTRSSSAKRKPTGFKPEIPLLSADAPVQDRRYALPSSTSRKRQPAVLAKELAKRQRKGEDVSALQTPDGELSQDLLDVIERKRLQNTLAARKSRARKQGRLEELERENEKLRGENEGLVERVRRMEEVLKEVGLLPAV